MCPLSTGRLRAAPTIATREKTRAVALTGNYLTASPEVYAQAEFREVTGGSNLTLTLQWNTPDTTLDFIPTQTRLNHYINNAWDQHLTASE
jgi:hypothetical protein